MIRVKTEWKFGEKIFILGGNVRTKEQAEEVLKDMYPDSLNIKVIELLEA